jgi:ribosomal protein S18 acetylase RimI-like enzyme
MYTISDTRKQELRELMDCHIASFPDSLSSKLGRAYVQKSLQWFLVNQNRFLFHAKAEGKVVGYCGGFAPLKPGDGSSSGMLQYAFNDAMKGIAKKPFLLFHPEVRQHYPFLWLNIKRKLTGKATPIAPVSSTNPYTRYVGLVVIAVHPEHQGSGIAQHLMTEFERRVKAFNQNEVVLSVKKNNERAINAYKKFGWQIKEIHTQTYVMNKFL